MVNKQLDPENDNFLVETNLPTPMTARVYVNLLEGNLSMSWCGFSEFLFFFFIPFRGYLPGTSKRKTGQFRCDLLRCEAECVDVPFLQKFLQIDLSALAAKHLQKKTGVYQVCTHFWLVKTLLPKKRDPKS